MLRIIPRMPSEETILRLLALTSPSSSAAYRLGAESSVREEADRLGTITSAALASPSVRSLLTRNGPGTVMEAARTGNVPTTFGPLNFEESCFSHSERGRASFQERVRLVAAESRGGRVAPVVLRAVWDAILDWRFGAKKT